MMSPRFRFGEPDSGGHVRRIGILVSGRGSNMVALLEAAAQGELGAEPAVVFSNRANAPALERARAAGVPVEHRSHRAYDSREAFDAAVVDCLAGYDLDGVVLAGYMRIVTPVFLRAYPDAVINIHPSLLPAFPGTRAVEQAWEYGVKVTGCTIHLVDEQVDHGPIILQRTLEVGDARDADDLASRLLAVEHQTLVDAVRLWAEGRIRIEGRRVRILPVE